MKLKKRKEERAWQPYYCKDRKSWVVPLTQGYEALIDECDVSDVQEYKWFANNVASSTRRLTKSYIYPSSRLGLPRNYVYLHRFIMDAPKGMTVDHINGNTMDNRRANLRVCTYRENSCNRETHRSGKLVGTYRTKHGKYAAQIKIDGALKYIGIYPTEYEAHQAYLEAYKDIIAKERSAA